MVTQHGGFVQVVTQEMRLLPPFPRVASKLHHPPDVVESFLDPRQFRWGWWGATFKRFPTIWFTSNNTGHISPGLAGLLAQGHQVENEVVCSNPGKGRVEVREAWFVCHR